MKKKTNSKTKPAEAVVSRDEVVAFYHDIRKGDKSENLNAVTHFDSAIREDYKMLGSILERIAQKATEVEFVEFIMHGEAPPVKLSKGEMAFMKGAGVNYGNFSLTTSPGTTAQVSGPYGRQVNIFPVNFNYTSQTSMGGRTYDVNTREVNQVHREVRDSFGQPSNRTVGVERNVVGRSYTPQLSSWERVAVSIFSRWGG
jgi:hypothetical protein